MRKIIIAGQNETVRRRYPLINIDLATTGLISCVALIIQDKMAMPA